MIEFTVTFLLFLVTLVALFELGRGVWTYTTVVHAAREGARLAMLRGDLTEEQIREAVQRNAVGLSSDDLNVNVAYSPDNSRGAIVSTRVTYPFRFVTGALIIPNSTLTISTTAQRVVLQ